MTLSSHSQPLDDGTTTTATIVFAGVPAADETIVIVDAAGTSRTFTAKGSESATALEFNRASTAAAAAISLKACIDHANGFNEASITAAIDPAGTITLTLASPGTYRFKNKASITDGLANVTATQFGSGGGAEDIDGHTIAGGGNSAAPTLTATNGGWNSKTNNKSNVDLVKGRKMSGSKVVAKTGSIGKAGVENALASGGTLAYNPQGRSVSLSTSPKQGADDGSDNFGWLIRGGVGTLLSGKASTNNFLAVPGSGKGRGVFAGAKHYHRKGTWADQVFDLQSGLLKQADGTDKADISGRGTTVNFAADQGHPTRAIPGELVILFNFASFTTNLVDYSALNG